ncbi:MAG: hypothetical protein WDW36_009530 [Sanguina aurantia]
MGAMAAAKGQEALSRREAATHLATTYSYIILWVVLSAGVIMINKYILSYAGFPFPVALTLIHMVFCSAVATLLIKSGVVEAVNMPSDLYFRGVVPIALLFAMVLWLGNAAYLHLSVSFIQMLKASMPVTVFVAGIILGTERYQFNYAANLVMIAAGIAIASYGEVHFVMLGVLYQASSVIFESFRLGLVQLILQSKGIKLNPVTTLFYIAPACAAFLTIPFAFLELPKMRDPATEWSLNPLLLAGSAVSALSLNLAVFLLIGRTSALTMNVAGVMKDWILIGLSVIMYKSHVSTMQLVGYGIAFVGVLFYNNSKNLAQPAPRSPSSQDQALAQQSRDEGTSLLRKDLDEGDRALEVVHADCEQLLSSVAGTAQMAEHISSKVRRLDLAQQRVSASLARVNLILDRSACIAGVQSAMDNEDYETAAAHVATFSSLEARLHSGSANHAMDLAQAEDQRKVLREAKSQLEAVVERRFDEAVASRDSATAVRFAKLYKPLGKQAEGLRRLVEFLRVGVAAQARSQYAALSSALEGANAKKVDFAAALSLLFKEVAVCLDNHEPIVSGVFGADAVMELVGGLQQECDVHGSKLLARFLEARKVGALVAQVAGRQGGGGGGGRNSGDPFNQPHSGGGGGGGQQPTGVDHRVVEGTLEEVLRLCQLSEEYNHFMMGRMRAAIAPAPLNAVRETSFRSGAFNVAVREMLGYYMTLEEYYMDETTTMAVRIDESTPGALTSSMVDDVFFIMRKCGLRCLASGSVQCMCALLGELNNVLANAYRNALLQRLGQGPARLLANAPHAGDGGGAGSHQPSAFALEYATALNNTDVSAEYVTKLRAELESYIVELLPLASERERGRSVLADLSKTSSDLRQMVSKSLESLSEALLPRLRPTLEGDVTAASYCLSELEYAGRESEGAPWVGRLLAALDNAMLWLQPFLTTDNYEGLFHLVVDKVVSRLEGILSRKQFNQLGGLQLDRDTRLLVSLLGERSARTVRDKCGRLTQTAMLLGMESVEELLEFWGDRAGHVTWRLSPAEVRSVLSQRVEFSRDAILMLQL